MTDTQLKHSTQTPTNTNTQGAAIFRSNLDSHTRWAPLAGRSIRNLLKYKIEKFKFTINNRMDMIIQLKLLKILASSSSSLSSWSQCTELPWYQIYHPPNLHWLPNYPCNSAARHRPRESTKHPHIHTIQEEYQLALYRPSLRWPSHSRGGVATHQSDNSSKQQII